MNCGDSTEQDAGRPARTRELENELIRLVKDVRKVEDDLRIISDNRKGGLVGVGLGIASGAVKMMANCDFARQYENILQYASDVMLLTGAGLVLYYFAKGTAQIIAANRKANKSFEDKIFCIKTRREGKYIEV